MKEKTTTPKNKAGKLCTVIGTVCILLVIGLCALVVLPGNFGWHMYDVLSGSMEPELPVGSLVYVRGTQPEEVKEGDIIAFYSSVENGGAITHRVVENNVVSGKLRTKGDANDTEDPLPVEYEQYIGQVAFHLPYFGKILTCMTMPYGKIAAACVIALGLILNLAGSRMRIEEA